MPTTKPLVAIATVCEKVLQEKDGVASIIRVVDLFTLPHNIQRSELALPLTVAVSLKSGDARGTFELELQVRKPNGETKTLPEKWPIVLEGGAHGANLMVQFALKTEQLGLYWIDVLCDGEVLTSMPVTLQQSENSESGKTG
jgi:hypothetical protein